jgi:hypothetical protein
MTPILIIINATNAYSKYVRVVMINTNQIHVLCAGIKSITTTYLLILLFNNYNIYLLLILVLN